MRVNSNTNSPVERPSLTLALRHRLDTPVGHRMLIGWLAAPFRPGNYAALLNAFRTSPDRRALLTRYLTGRGRYPYAAHVRTPIGERKVTLFSPHDVLTLTEVFFRRDYPVASDIRVAVDIGANIGLSTLWFLSRNEVARCYSFEPHPENARKLRENLTGLGDRYALHEAAVGTESGPVEFGIEPTGRYGAIGAATGTSITVECRAVNEVLAEVLEREPAIDVLKIDTEGLEVETVAAIEPRFLDRIRLIYFEAGERPGSLHASRFDRGRRVYVERLERREHPDADGE